MRRDIIIGILFIILGVLVLADIVSLNILVAIAFIVFGIMQII